MPSQKRDAQTTEVTIRLPASDNIFVGPVSPLRIWTSNELQPAACLRIGNSHAQASTPDRPPRIGVNDAVLTRLFTQAVKEKKDYQKNKAYNKENQTILKTALSTQESYRERQI